MTKYRPNGGTVTIREQVVEDPVSKLTLQFERRDDGSAKLTLYGAALPYGNRDIVFDANGNEVGTGTHIGSCRPAWPGPLEAEP